MAVKILNQAYLSKQEIIEWLKDDGYIETSTKIKSAFVHRSNDDIVGRISNKLLNRMIEEDTLKMDPAAFSYHNFYSLKKS